MRPRFSLLTLCLTLAVGLVVGGAVFGFFASSFYDAQASAMIGTFAAAMGRVLGPVFGVLLLSAAAGALTWGALFYLRLDGVHRLEWVALLPRNYGGKSPFDLGR